MIRCFRPRFVPGPTSLPFVSPANPDTLIGRLIDGRYQVRSLIARGGMATVYVATDLRLERRIAIKIMHDHLAADLAFRERFIREARAAARLTHPNLVNVYDQGEDEGLAYIVMEYVPGITLRDLLHDHHRLTVEQTIDIMDAVLAGLQVAHRQGIIHRDIKPENVLLADDGRIKLSDFGLARGTTSNTATGSVLLGTIAYLAPELVTRGTADVRSDIYSCGIMMYELLVGEQPYRGDEPVNIAFRHANDNVPPPSEQQHDLPQELDDLVVWATERDAEDRPADAGAMLAALREAERSITSSHGVTAPPVAGFTAGYAAAESQQVAESDDSEPDWEHLTTPTDPSSLVDGLGGAKGASLVASTSTEASEPTEHAAVRLEKINRQKRRSGLVATLVVAVLIMLAAGIGWYQGLGPGSYLAAPDVSGASEGDAAAMLAEQGFAVGEVSFENSLDVPEGMVMGMDPGAGSRLAPESEVNLIVSAGPEIKIVPQLSDVPLDEAIERITSAGFTYDVEGSATQFDEAPQDTVLYGLTADGSELPQEMPEQSAIRLVISAGPVPEVSGMGESEAVAALDAVGLIGSVVSSEYSSQVPAGLIIRQAAGEGPIRPGDEIQLVVSLGPDMVAVPDVVGMPANEAIAALESAGFTVSHSIPEILREDATVANQSPAAGEELERGSTVSIQATYLF